MHGTSVVPKNKIIRMPFVTIGKCRLRGMRRQLVEESSAAFFWPPDDVNRAMRGRGACGWRFQLWRTKTCGTGGSSCLAPFV